MTDQPDAYPAPLTPAGVAALVPCSHGNGCPLGVDAPAIASALREGDHPRAYLIARGPNPFASVCGHGCHAPCESACRRRLYGAPVAIAALEAYASGFSVPSLMASPGPCTSPHDARSVRGLLGAGTGLDSEPPRSGRRVAIIGAGPAGLGCAHDLALLGHECHIFESSGEPGGLLTHALPSFRFALAHARAECDVMLSLPIVFHGGQEQLGATPLRRLLEAGFHAVFLAIGASAAGVSPLLSPPGHPDVIDAMEVLADRQPTAGRVVVVGEGDLAVDAARLALRRARGGTAGTGARVVLVLSSSPEESREPPHMLAGAIADGVEILHGWQAQGMSSDDADGRLTGVVIVRLQGQGELLLSCEQLLVAGPRVAPVSPFAGELAIESGAFIATDPETLQTSMRRVWAGGACAFGHRSIAHALADGKRAAWQIHGELMGRRVGVRLASAWSEADDWDAARTPLALVQRRRTLAVLDQTPPDPFAERSPAALHDALHEAQRCFDCATLPVVDSSCTSCGKCVPTCPVGALSLGTGDSPVLVLDQELCNRCGACVAACPTGALAMARGVWEERLRYVS
ncbi:MAG: FAD-dependent oxidoreductase [Gemmatimonadota bacterium]|nr:FAD-dependent oxidoreductase [Gemmatimonadota bacterium]